jgi:hypothetical protein
MKNNWQHPHIDYYMSLCPDMWFHEHSLYYLIESAKNIPDKYFIITPEIHKLWDWTWDELVNENYQNISYENWNKSDIFEIQSKALDEPYLQQLTRFKYAGWFDLYSKDFMELIPIHDDWKVYGPWDYYSMLVSDIAVKNGIQIIISLNINLLRFVYKIIFSYKFLQLVSPLAY